jgi:hypothetical protein
MSSGSEFCTNNEKGAAAGPPQSDRNDLTQEPPKGKIITAINEGGNPKEALQGPAGQDLPATCGRPRASTGTGGATLTDQGMTCQPSAVPTSGVSLPTEVALEWMSDEEPSEEETAKELLEKEAGHTASPAPAEETTLTEVSETDNTEDQQQQQQQQLQQPQLQQGQQQPDIQQTQQTQQTVQKKHIKLDTKQQALAEQERKHREHLEQKQRDKIALRQRNSEARRAAQELLLSQQQGQTTTTDQGLTTQHQGEQTQPEQQAQQEHAHTNRQGVTDGQQQQNPQLEEKEVGQEESTSLGSSQQQLEGLFHSSDKGKRRGTLLLQPLVQKKQPTASERREPNSSTRGREH